MSTPFDAGTVLISAMGGDNELSYAIGPGGQVTSVAESLTSECGKDFDDYVKRVMDDPFPYSSMIPASRTIQTLWKGRRFQLFVGGPDKFRTGHVVEWEEWNTGPLSYTTNWALVVQFDSSSSPFSPGDTITIQGLKSAKEHNGQRGIIHKFLPDREGRYMVQLCDKKRTWIAIKPQNMVQTFSVHRMNIDGGGTLRNDYKTFRSNPNGTATALRHELLSLEWLEPAIPSIDLNEGALQANCPVCRAVEPPSMAYQDAEQDISTPNDAAIADGDPPSINGVNTTKPTTNETTETARECPICLETAACRVLQCQHQVCRSCWDKWRNSSSGLPVTEPNDDDPQALQTKREEEVAKLRVIEPHIVGGIATKPGDSDEVVQQALNEAYAYCYKILDSLSEMAKSGEEGLYEFWRQLKTVPMLLFLLVEFNVFMQREFAIPALEIALRVAVQRRDELYDEYSIINGEVPDDKAKGILDFLFVGFCNRMGEFHEEVHNYRGAIPWYERAVGHCQKALQFQGCDKEVSRRVAIQYCNLGLAQKYAGFLSAALENYNSSLKLSNDVTNDVAENRKTLLREMNEWRGTSGRLTPGC